MGSYELIEAAPLAQDLQDFPFPKHPEKILWTPMDLTRGQAKELGRMMKAAGEQDPDEFLEMVFNYVITLPGSRWNLGRGDSPIPLNAETTEAECGKDDWAALAVSICTHYYPGMFDPQDEATESTDDLDGLEIEPGSQAAGVLDPNAQRPRLHSVAKEA